MTPLAQAIHDAIESLPPRHRNPERFAEDLAAAIRTHQHDLAIERTTRAGRLGGQLAAERPPDPRFPWNTA